MKGPEYYKLDADRNVVPATRDEFYAMHADIDGRRVGKYEDADVMVSTVFLGTDHNFSFDPNDTTPVCFETLVFGGPLADEMERYATWDEAVAGHEAMVARVRAARP